jgi:fumarate hydratase class II
MPTEVYHAYGYVKRAAAVVNTAAGRLPAWKGQLIQRVCDEVISGQLDPEFPLYVWQTGTCSRRVESGRGQPVEDRQRPALAGLRPPHRHR